VHGPKEVIEESLPRRRVVEDISHERGLRRLLDEVLEPRGSSLETAEEERVARGVADRELRGVQVPALIEAADERVADMRICKPPGPMDGLARAHRHDVRRAVRKPETRARELDLHEILREVASRV